MGTRGRLWLTIAVVCGAIATSAIALAPPATNFEPSIYAVYPVWILGLFAAALVGGLASALHAGWNGLSRRWGVSMALVLGLYTVLFALPVLRGYVLFGRGGYDVLVHLGFVKTIVATGHLPPRDWYPIIHILSAALTFVGIPRTATLVVIQSTIFSVYVFGVYCYVRRQVTPRAGMLAATATLPLVLGEFHTSMHPSIFSFLLLPLVFMTIHQNGWRWRMAVLVLLTALVFFHPVTTVFALCYIGAALVVQGWQRWRGPSAPTTTAPPTTAALVGGIVLSIWYLNFPRTRQAIVGLLLTPKTGSVGGGTAMALSPLHLVIRATRLYGDVALIAGMSVVAAVLVGLAIRYGRLRSPGRWLHLIAQWGVGIGLFVVLFVVGPINPIRAARYLLLFAAILVGIALAALATVRPTLPSRASRVGMQAIAVLGALGIVVAGVIGAVGVYPKGNHLTHAETESVEWILNYTEPEPLLSLDMSHDMAIFVRGAHAAPSYRRFRKHSAAFSLPSHLGYRQHRSVAALHNGSFYIYTKQHDIEYYKASYREQWPALTWYTRADLRRLRTDPAAARIYTAGFGNASVWWVPGNRTTPG